MSKYLFNLLRVDGYMVRMNKKLYRLRFRGELY